MISKDKKIIFILGHGRSGTTLLNKILSAHPDIHFISSEFNDLPFFYYNQYLYQKYKHKKYAIMSRDFFNHPYISQHIKFIKNADNFEQFLDNIFDYFRGKEKKNIIGMKISNNISENVDMIKAVFKDGYCIHIIRDPRDVFLSLKKTPFFGTRSPFYAGKSWKEAINKISSLRGKAKNYYEIKYEKLITEPAKEIKMLCTFLNIEFSEEMLSFDKKIEKVPPYHKLLKRGFVKNNLNKWKTEVKKEELALIYTACGKEMYELGYADKEYQFNITFFRRLWEFISDKTIFYLKLLKTRNLFGFCRLDYKIKIRLIRYMGCQKQMKK